MWKSALRCVARGTDRHVEAMPWARNPVIDVATAHGGGPRADLEDGGGVAHLDGHLLASARVSDLHIEAAKVAAGAVDEPVAGVKVIEGLGPERDGRKLTLGPADDGHHVRLRDEGAVDRQPPPVEPEACILHLDVERKAGGREKGVVGATATSKIGVPTVCKGEMRVLPRARPRACRHGGNARG